MIVHLYSTCKLEIFKMFLYPVIKMSSFLFRPEKETSEDSDSSPPYLPTQPTAPQESEYVEHHMVQSYVRDVAV